MITFADLCSGPGGFTEYILWRMSLSSKIKCKGWGMTLRGEQDFDFNSFNSASSKSLQDKSNFFEPFYGNDDSGDITKLSNVLDFAGLVNQGTHLGNGVDLVTADGVFPRFNNSNSSSHIFDYRE